MVHAYPILLSNQIEFDHSVTDCHRSLGLPAHGVVFIFFKFFKRSLQIFSLQQFSKMQSSSLTNVAIDNLHSSASQIFGFFKSSFFNVGLDKSSYLSNTSGLKCQPNTPLTDGHRSLATTCTNMSTSVACDQFVDIKLI